MQPGQLASIIPGQVITPDAVLDPMSMAAHAFCNVVRDLVFRSPVYHTESDRHAALDAVDAFERRMVPSQDRQHVLSEDDPAPREDVSQRVPPRVGAMPVPVGPAIDYAALAKALVAAQQAAQENAQANPPAPVQPVQPPFGG